MRTNTVKARLRAGETVHGCFVRYPEPALIEMLGYFGWDYVMFDGEQLTGFFDFYFAGCDTWLFDVAVTVNDWCIDLETGETDAVRVRALLDAYASVRNFTAEEKQAWPAMLRAGALRFWLSRLYDFYLPREAELLTPHDPTHFERVLTLRRQVTWAYQRASA